MDDKRLIEYFRIRDIVGFIYANYILKELEQYGDKVDVDYIAGEQMLLILSILKDKTHLTDEAISNLAVRECNVKRKWHQ